MKIAFIGGGTLWRPGVIDAAPGWRGLDHLRALTVADL
jgi:hypothetical protein